MARDSNEAAKAAQAHSVFVRLALPPYTIHFKSPTYLRPNVLDLLDKKVCKETLKSTAQSAAVRKAIGRDGRFWAELVLLLQAAVPSLEKRSFTVWEAGRVDYESTSGALIANNYPGLWRDLERLNDIVSIARNVLTFGYSVQDLAAEHHLDPEIFRLINCCVRVTARGYEGDAGTGEEEKWQWTLGAYKKLLITSLQVLNNLTAQNENRKLHLWSALFDSAMDLVFEGPHDEESKQQVATVKAEESLAAHPAAKFPPPTTNADILLAYGANGSSRVSPLEYEGAVPIFPDEGFKQPPQRILNNIAKESFGHNGYVLYTKLRKDDIVREYQEFHGRNPSLAEIHRAIPSYWHMEAQDKHDGDLEEMWNEWRKKYMNTLIKSFAEYNKEKGIDEAALSETPPPPKAITDGGKSQQIEKAESNRPQRNEVKNLTITEKLHLLKQRLEENAQAPPQGGEAHVEHLDEATQTTVRGSYTSLKNLQDTLAELGLPETLALVSTDHAVAEKDLSMPYTAEAGAKILDSGKAELMKKLEGYEPDEPRELDNGQTEEVDALIDEQQANDDAQDGEHWALSRTEKSSGRRKSTHSLEQSFAAPASVSADSLEVEDDEESDEEGEEDYPGSTEDGRGLLTDVPLILGPSEIEVLPMLIMSGIVPPSNSQSNAYHCPKCEAAAVAAEEQVHHLYMNPYSIRTHVLLGRTSGRNLLRELLIFVAAWDLREEELYFKFMVKIMDAILKAGLMPYAYHAFRDRSRSKDIISPAQAVIMKLLTCIFRGRNDAAKAAVAHAAAHTQEVSNGKVLSTPAIAVSNGPSRVDVHILNFIFAEFRQHIIPQTCALIFLQGQIHKGRASPDDFPMNLWDMERMYEGVYQYLEFFAVLTEEQAAKATKAQLDGEESDEDEANDPTHAFSWKQILADWQMSSELVTLLRELELGIPKLGAIHQPGFGPPPPKPRYIDPPSPPMQKSNSTGAAVTPPPVAVERPFDVDGADPPLPSLPSLYPPPPKHDIFEAETPLAYPEDPAATHGTHDAQHEQEEPSDFEWRNLKKLTVLVLSSLLWKSKQVQDQVREYGGLEALVSACKTDHHNPYIREHVIMCLRFAIENNEESAAIIRKIGKTRNGHEPFPDDPLVLRGFYRLSKTDAVLVPREILATDRYETFLDHKGQVGLRRKDLSASTYPPSDPKSRTIAKAVPPSATSGSSARSMTKMTAEKAAELMQNALRDLPLGDKLVTDRLQAEALARLDRAFESTEKALGRSLNPSAKEEDKKG